MTDALLVTSSFLPGRGGIESYLAELCDLLSPRLAVFAPEKRDGAPIPELDYPTEGWPGRMLVPSNKIAAAIEALVGKHSTDKVLFGTPWPLALLGPRLEKRGLRYAIVIHGAELIAPGAMPILGRALARSLAGADLLLPVSRYTAGHALRLLEKHRLAAPPVELLRARVDLQRFHPDVGKGTRAHFGIPDDASLLLCFGRLVRRKGVHRLLTIWDELAPRFPGLTLAVGGTGPELKRLKRASGGNPAIRFLGRVAEDRAAGLYAAADLFALPVADRWWGLETEGLGVVLLEAAACGTPCVTGRSGGTPEAVVDGISGYVVDATDRAELREAIAKVLDDPETARAMGAAGREHVKQVFSGPLPANFAEWLASA